MSGRKFKVGDLITGIDRSYERSIYLYCGDDPTEPDYGHYRILSYSGRVFDESFGHTINDNANFRLASNLEILKSATRSHFKLKRLALMLINRKRIRDLF